MDFPTAAIDSILCALLAPAAAVRAADDFDGKRMRRKGA